jgi:DNA-binding response OmpR family regulator
MSQQAAVLVVDDEASIRLTLRALLERAGHRVVEAEHGEAALALVEQQAFDLMLVDLKMPGMDGMQVVEGARARQPDLAVIVLTGHGSLDSAIDGLHHGVFDYILKTAEPPYVVERVKAGLAERAQRLRQRTLLDAVGAAVQELRGGVAEPSAASGSERVLTIGALQLDSWHQAATLNGRTLALTPTEFRVLLCLAEHAGTMLSYAHLVRCAQGYDTTEQEASELIKPHIHHLRQKLEADPSAPRYILNVRGKGYLLSPVGE